MGELSESDHIFISELQRRMKFYERIVYAFVKVSAKFREPEKTVAKRILGGGGISDVKSELLTGGQTQEKLEFRP